MRKLSLGLAGVIAAFAAAASAAESFGAGMRQLPAALDLALAPREGGGRGRRPRRYRGRTTHWVGRANPAGTKLLRKAREGTLGIARLR